MEKKNPYLVKVSIVPSLWNFSSASKNVDDVCEFNEYIIYIYALW